MPGTAVTVVAGDIVTVSTAMAPPDQAARLFLARPPEVYVEDLERQDDARPLLNLIDTSGPDTLRSFMKHANKRCCF